MSAGAGTGLLHRLAPTRLLPDTLSAVFAKELRYLARSTPGKLVLLVSPLFVAMIALAVGRLSFVKEPLWGVDPAVYAFYGVLLYAGLLSSNFLVNAYAWDFGDGTTFDTELATVQHAFQGFGRWRRGVDEFVHLFRRGR